MSGVRALLADLVGNLRAKHASYLEKYRAISLLVRDNRPSTAGMMLKELPIDAPTEDRQMPFGELRSEIEKALAAANVFLHDARGAASLGQLDKAMILFDRAEAADAVLAPYSDLRRAARDRARALADRREQIQSFLEDRRVTSAGRAFEAAKPLLPADESTYGFSALGAEIRVAEQAYTQAASQAQAAEAASSFKRAVELWQHAATLDRDQDLTTQIGRARTLEKANRPPRSKKLLGYGLLTSGVLALAGWSSDAQIQEKLTEMDELVPGTTSWNLLLDEAENFERQRDIFYYSAAGVFGLVALVEIGRAVFTDSTSPAGLTRQQRPKKFWTVSLDPKRPAIFAGVRF
jgi:tetratricopeptide (TPR) repeat protein